MCMCVCACIHNFKAHIFFKQLPIELPMCVYMSWLTQFTTALLDSHDHLRNLQSEGRCTNVVHTGTYQRVLNQWRGSVFKEASPDVLCGFSLNSLLLSLYHSSPPALPIVKYSSISRMQGSVLAGYTFFNLHFSSRKLLQSYDIKSTWTFYVLDNF